VTVRQEITGNQQTLSAILWMLSYYQLSVISYQFLAVSF
jgi:hypothetical protein